MISVRSVQMWRTAAERGGLLVVRQVLKALGDQCASGTCATEILPGCYSEVEHLDRKRYKTSDQWVNISPSTTILKGAKKASCRRRGPMSNSGLVIDFKCCH